MLLGCEGCNKTVRSEKALNYFCVCVDTIDYPYLKPLSPARARARARAHKYAYLSEYWEFFLSEKCVIFLSSIYVQISIANVIYDFFIPTMVCIFLFVAYGGVSRRAACTPLRHRAGTNRP